MINYKQEFEVAKKFIPSKYWNRLMFMGIKGENVYMYKYIDTSMYIYIDTYGTFFLYDNGVLVETTQDKALKHMLS